MDYIRIDPLIDGRPKMIRAGWWACRVFELLIKVSGKYDLHGEFSEHYADGEWLAREWNYSASDSQPAWPGASVEHGIRRLVEVGLLARAITGYSMPGWEEFYGRRDLSTGRVKKYRAARALAGTVGATGNGETDETDETLHHPHHPLKEKEEPNRVASAVPASALMKLWNEKTADKRMPQCAKLAGDRERLTVARLREQPEMAYWSSVLDRILASDFCRGKNDRGWKASYDWFVHPLTHAKVVEGKYDNRSAPSNVRVVALGEDLYGR